MSKLTRRRLGDWAVALVAALGAVVIAWVVVVADRQSDRIDHQDEQIAALAAALADEQSAAEGRGETPVAPAPEELIEDPEAPAPTPVGPSDEQVLEAVESYFRVHPVEDGQDATPAAIAAAVINYLTEHPPAQGEPGPAPTGDQILAAVSTYLAANPPPAGPQGPAGADGEDGHTPTSAEIQAELAAYLQAHPVEMCPTGTTAQALTVLTVGAPTDIVACVTTEEE